MISGADPAHRPPPSRRLARLALAASILPIIIAIAGHIWSFNRYALWSSRVDASGTQTLVWASQGTVSFMRVTGVTFGDGWIVSAPDPAPLGKPELWPPISIANNATSSRIGVRIWLAAAIALPLALPFVISTARRRRRHARGQCPACAYDLGGATQNTCPECGAGKATVR